jgi:hypothetical protein
MAQSYFSIITPTGFINMDATLTAKRNLPSSSTEFPVESGGFAADNIVNEGEVINFSGVITDVKSISGIENPSTSDFIKLIEKIRNNKELVSVNVGLSNDTISSNSFKTITGCVLLNADFLQDVENGIAYNKISAYKVELTFKKIRFIKTATLSTRLVTIPLKDRVKAVPQSSADETTKSTLNSRGVILSDTQILLRSIAVNEHITTDIKRQAQQNAADGVDFAGNPVD